jgi:hypothetical protein
VRQVQCHSWAVGEKIGSSRNFRCNKMRNSSLEKQFVGVRRDILARGMLVRGDKREGR